MSDDVIDGVIRDAGLPDNGGESPGLQAGGESPALPPGVHALDNEGRPVDRWGRPVRADRRLVVVDGVDCWEYPGGGLRRVDNGHIIRPGAGLGIPRGDSERARELSAIGNAKLRAAALDGAASAASRLGLSGIPTDAVSAVVEALVVRAVQGSGREANEAAKIFMQVVGLLGGRAVVSGDDDGGDGVTVKASFRGASARALLDVIDSARSRSPGG